MNSTVTFPINTQVRIIAGTHRGKSGIVGNGKPTTRNTGKIEVLVGCRNASIWCKPEWLQCEEKCCSDLYQSQNLQVNDLSDASNPTAVEVQEVLEEIEDTMFVQPDVQVSPLLPKEWKVGDHVRTDALKYPPIPSQEVTVVEVPTSDKPDLPVQNQQQENTENGYKCSDLKHLACSPELADLTMQQGSSESKQPSLSRSIHSAKKSYEDTSLLFLSTMMSVPLTQGEESGKLCMEDFHATELVALVTEKDSATSTAHFGGKCSGSSNSQNQHLSLSKIQKVCDIEDLPKLFTALPATGMWGNGSVYQLPTLERPIYDKESLLLPTPTASDAEGKNYRPAGGNKLTEKLKRLNLLPDSQVLSAEVVELMQGFPMGWTSPSESSAIIQTNTYLEDKCSDELSFLSVPRSRSEEFSTLALSSESASQKFVVGDRVKHRFSYYEGTVIRLALDEAFILWEAHPEHETLYRNEDLVKLPICENFSDGSLSNGKDTGASTEIDCPHDLSENFPKPGKAWIDPHEIDLCAGTQSRDRTDWETVQRYSELMKENLWDWEREPRPVVFQDKDGCKYPGDCHHRTEAAIKAGVDLICVDLRDGSLVDAIMFSCIAEANRSHGLPLTAKDQRRRIELFLDVRSSLPVTDERRRYSSREIARYLRLTDSGYRTVCNILNEREMSVKISQFQEGDRVQVVRSGATGSGAYWSDGTLGKVQDIDKKKGILVLPDATTVHIDKWMLSHGWIHPDNLIKSDAPLPEAPVKISQDEEESEAEWLVDDLCQYRGTAGQIVRIEGDDVWVSLNGYLEMVPLFEIERTDPDHDSVLPPRFLVGEPKSKDKQLLPSIKRNSDIPLNAQTPPPAALVNRTAIAQGLPDVVANEIALGIRHLSPDQLAWVLTSAASNGLSDDHLKAVIKAAKLILNLRHHPEYFAPKREINQSRENMPSQCTLVPPVDFDERAELYCLDNEDITLGVGDEGVFLDDGDEGVFSDEGNFWLEEAS